MLLVVVCHVLGVVGLVRTYHCLHLDPGSFLCAWTRNSLKVSGQLFTAMQWALLTWRYWLPDAAPAPGSKGDPPCESEVSAPSPVTSHADAVQWSARSEQSREEP